ncbi:MAG: hypothetical protein ACD_58C00209G0003 [uncultured bacterium]|uniref:Uncharacterized protein n=1 Tax=Berkelbacteria bacterium GW2011_GWA2_38_9 TaxID=1618334 RepID=A0A0G0PL78_9BACT|nr:MAG: hypothetical protein ACD_58C00209G0003 [uncultured bacterium]KKQ90061.1 MAG: hypothetical protein UT11_C0013G0005 [Berkelbacteria bacterium GW2011_GWA2_38_9]
MIAQKTLNNKFDYISIQVNNLIIFGIYSIESKDEKCTFERLVAECFNLFPCSFCFSRYPQWPDSLKFDRSLRTLREEGLIVGNPRGLFSLTKFGKKIAEDTARLLKIGVKNKVQPLKMKRDAEINFINTFKMSSLFQKFLKNKSTFVISEMEVRNLVHCTLETPLRIVKQNMVYAEKLSKEFNEKLLCQFLNLCNQKLNKKL